MAPKAEKGIFLGYPANCPGYLVQVSNHVRISRSVVFDEMFTTRAGKTESSPMPLDTLRLIPETVFVGSYAPSGVVQPVLPQVTDAEQQPQAEIPGENPVDVHVGSSEGTLTPTTVTSEPVTDDASVSTQTEPIPPPISPEAHSDDQSSGSATPFMASPSVPLNLRSHTPGIGVKSNLQPPVTGVRTRKKTAKLQESSVPEHSADIAIAESDTHLDDFVAFLTQTGVVNPGDPTTIRSALESDRSESWRQAILSEYNSLVKDNTWNVVQLGQ